MTRIVQTKTILGGKPRIAGTRTSVELIGAYIGSGLTIKDIKKDYPHLTNKEISVALKYYENRIDDERAKLEPKTA